MRATSVESLVKEHAPVRRGHFLLSSGMHTPYYVELEAIVQDPSLTATVCHAIAERFQEQRPQAVLTVLGPDSILGYELARELGARAIFVDGPMTATSAAATIAPVRRHPALKMQAAVNARYKPAQSMRRPRHGTS